MKRVEDHGSAYQYAGAIIAYNTTSSYFGSEKGNILDSETIFAKLDTYITSWCHKETDEEGGYKMYIFKKADTIRSNIVLASSTLKNYADGYLDIRYATVEEVNKLRELVENDQIKLGCKTKKKTIKDIGYYLENIDKKDFSGDPVFFPEGLTSFPIPLEDYETFDPFSYVSFGESNNVYAEILGEID